METTPTTKNTDIHPRLSQYDRQRIVMETMIGSDCHATVMEWRPMSTANGYFIHQQLFTVQWTDFVANDWCEVYETLSEALGRVALLSACQESNWDIGFRDDERWWSDRWFKFVKSATTEPIHEGGLT